MSDYPTPALLICSFKFPPSPPQAPQPPQPIASQAPSTPSDMLHEALRQPLHTIPQAPSIPSAMLPLPLLGPCQCSLAIFLHHCLACQHNQVIAAHHPCGPLKALRKYLHTILQAPSILSAMLPLLLLRPSQCSQAITPPPPTSPPIHSDTLPLLLLGPFETLRQLLSTQPSGPFNMLG